MSIEKANADRRNLAIDVGAVKAIVSAELAEDTLCERLAEVESSTERVAGATRVVGCHLETVEREEHARRGNRGTGVVAKSDSAEGPDPGAGEEKLLGQVYGGVGVGVASR